MVERTRLNVTFIRTLTVLLTLAIKCKQCKEVLRLVLSNINISYSVIVEEPKKRDRSEDLGFDGKIILKWMLEDVKTWNGFLWLRTGSNGGLCEHSKNISSCIKYEESLD